MTDWDQRTLCPDGACVGVIGADGTCKVCGRVAPNWGEERKRGLVEEPTDEEDEDLEGEEESEADEEVEGEASPEWDDRKLCPDGACVGVIGANGTCSVCGRSAS